MANKYVSMPIGFTRLDSAPLENNTVFHTEDGTSGVTLAQQYATSNPTAYPGQLITAQALDNTWAVYLIQNTKLLVKLMDYVDSEFTKDNLTADNKLLVGSDRVPRGIVSKSTGKFITISPTLLNSDGRYSIDLSGLQLDGTWIIKY